MCQSAIMCLCICIAKGNERNDTFHAWLQHEHPQQIFSINRTLWRDKTFMSSYFQEGDWQASSSSTLQGDFSTVCNNTETLSEY